MLIKFNKTQITTISEVAALGIKTGHKHLGCLGAKFSFESPISVSVVNFQGRCTVGYLTYFRAPSHISNTDFGRYCAVAPGAFIGGGEHPTDWLSTHSFQYGGGNAFNDVDEFTQIVGTKKFKQPKGGVFVGNDVWIGQGVTISRGVTIGDGAIIAARSMVTKDVAPYTVVAGVPALPIRKRFDDNTIERLARLQWWNYDLSPIAKKINYSDIQKSIELLEKSIEKKILPPLAPKKHTIYRDGKNFFVSNFTEAMMVKS